jgi:hypothetical protein
MTSSFGVLGLTAAVAGPRIAEALKPPVPPPQTLSDTLAEAGDMFVGRVLDRVRGKKPAAAAETQPPPPPTAWGW